MNPAKSLLPEDERRLAGTSGTRQLIRYSTFITVTFNVLIRRLSKADQVAFGMSIPGDLRFIQPAEPCDSTAGPSA
jgi:hypothetical protein